MACPIWSKDEARAIDFVRVGLLPQEIGVATLESDCRRTKNKIRLKFWEEVYFGVIFPKSQVLLDLEQR